MTSGALPAMSSKTDLIGNAIGKAATGRAMRDELPVRAMMRFTSSWIDISSYIQTHSVIEEPSTVSKSRTISSPMFVLEVP